MGATEIIGPLWKRVLGVVESLGDVKLNGDLTVDEISAAEDSGAVTLVDMPVSDTPNAGNEMSFTVKIDGENIIKAYAEADSAGGIQNPAVKAYGPIILSQYAQVLTGAGAIDVVSAITHLNNVGGDALTLADGVEGQIKHIVVKTFSGSISQITPTHFTGGTYINFDSSGETVTLLFTSGTWYIIGIYGAVVA